MSAIVLGAKVSQEIYHFYMLENEEEETDSSRFENGGKLRANLRLLSLTPVHWCDMIDIMCVFATFFNIDLKILCNFPKSIPIGIILICVVVFFSFERKKGKLIKIGIILRINSDKLLSLILSRIHISVISYRSFLQEKFFNCKRWVLIDI